MIDNDNRSLAESVALIQWCQADPFWKSNVMSMPKFREKFDTMRLQRASKTVPSSKPVSSVEDVVARRERVMQGE